MPAFGRQRFVGLGILRYLALVCPWSRAGGPGRPGSWRAGPGAHAPRKTAVHAVYMPMGRSWGRAATRQAIAVALGRVADRRKYFVSG